MDGEHYEGKPVIEAKAVKPTPEQLSRAREVCEMARLRVENIELKASIINIEHPKAVELFNEAKAALEALELIAKQ
jgi:hypothetical protein